MLFSANEAPAAADTSEGYYSRWIVIPFHRVIPPDRGSPSTSSTRACTSRASCPGY
jgi:phage/plasmid-associated DNA primase